MFCEIGLRLWQDTQGLYQKPYDEQLRILALNYGPWRDDEMQADVLMVTGVKFASDDAESRFGQIFRKGR